MTLADVRSSAPAPTLKGLLLGLLVAGAASSASGCASVLNLDRDPPIVGSPDFASSPQLAGTDGFDFFPAEVIVAPEEGVDGTEGFRILASNRLALCERIKDVISIEPGEQIVSISIKVDPLVVGHYELGGSDTGTATYVRANSPCDGQLDPVSGTGELDIVSTNGGVEGIADVTFSVGHARGSFTAKTCNALMARVLQCGPS
jgi:hypothetical protein